MKLTKVRVQNFKSIVDSSEVDIDQRLTILIGKNEQGKSNFLKALKSFNSDYKYVPNDLPNHLRPSLDEKPPKDVPIVTLWLKFEAKESEQIGELTENVQTAKYLKAVRFYGGNYKFTTIDSANKETEVKFAAPDISQYVERLKSAASELQAKLIAHTQRQAAFADSKQQFEKLIDGFVNANYSDTSQIDNLIKTFCTGIRGLPNQDEPIQNDISETTKNLETVSTEINKFLSQNENTNSLMKLVPKFILHRTSLDKIPNEVNVAEFITAPEQTSMGMLNLCRAAGLPLQKIQELAQSTDPSQRAVYEDYYNGLISGGLNEFWTQELYQVHFRIESEKLSVSITDNTYSRRIQPSERSDGFQWYLSFYTTLQNESGSASPLVILLDNPALELHVEGQRDIKKFLEEKTDTDTQVIYVTHSPAMVDPFKSEQIRGVELLGENQGTKVTNQLVKEGAHLDILEPLRSAIGSTVGYSLIAAKYNILVEGSADRFLLEGILYRFCPEIRGDFVVNGSVAESRECTLARIYNGLDFPFVVVLDADSGGRGLRSKLKKYEIEDKRIILINKLFPDREEDFALADVLDSDTYYEAVKLAYPEKDIQKPKDGGSKIENSYEDEFKQKYDIGFCKTRVAQSLKKILMDDSKKISDITEDNLKKLSGEIYKRLTDSD